MDERVVVEAWERQSYDRAPLRALGLSVVFRGLPSDAGGPDYQDAILSDSKGSLIRGDVEFHVSSSDWYRHRHHRDPAYDRVILHVVSKDDVATTVRSDGFAVPTLVLRPGGYALDEPMVLPLLTHPCVAGFRRMPKSSLEAQVGSLGRRRFELLRDRFGAEIATDSADQVAYRAMLEALGYASNRAAFRELAEVVPYAWLMSVPAPERGAVLLDAAGLGGPARVAPPAHLPPGSWRLSRLRPANHPARRLLGATQIVESLRPSLAEALAVAVTSAERPRDLRTVLTARSGANAWIGMGRADEMAASVVLPFVAAYEPRAGAIDLFARYPSPPHNRWTRTMLELFREAGHQLAVRTVPVHQGLHYLYHQFCRNEDFVACPVCATTQT